MQTCTADSCAVEGSREEIRLLFGTGSAPPSGNELPFGIPAGMTPDKSAKVRLSNCIILHPRVARELAALLNEAPAIKGALSGAAGKPRPLPDVLSAPCRVQGSAEKADLLARLINGLDIAYGLERSFKFAAGDMLANRFLLSIHRNTVTEDPYYLLEGICSRMGMPGEFLGKMKENLPYAKIVYFGFEEDEAACTFKVYLEFVDRMMDAMLTGERKSAPLLLFQGFKWDASDGSRRAITNYTCCPQCSPEAILERVSAVYYGSVHRDSLDIIRDIIGTASERLQRKELIYIDVTEEGNQRSSFDVNLYNAGLLLEDIAPQLWRACRHFTIPSEKFSGFYDRMRSRKFGHISGGIDRKGKDFLTFYYGMEDH